MSHTTDSIALLLSLQDQKIQKTSPIIPELCPTVSRTKNCLRNCYQNSHWISRLGGVSVQKSKSDQHCLDYTNCLFSRIERPKSIPTVFKVSPLFQGLKTVLETAIRSRIGQAVLEELVFKNLSPIGQKWEPKSMICYQQISPYETVYPLPCEKISLPQLKDF